MFLRIRSYALVPDHTALIKQAIYITVKKVADLGLLCLPDKFCKYLHNILCN